MRGGTFSSEMRALRFFKNGRFKASINHSLYLNMNNYKITEREIELEGILPRNHQRVCHGNYDIRMPSAPGY